MVGCNDNQTSIHIDIELKDYDTSLGVPQLRSERIFLFHDMTISFTIDMNDWQYSKAPQYMHFFKSDYKGEYNKYRLDQLIVDGNPVESGPETWTKREAQMQCWIVLASGFAEKLLADKPLITGNITILGDNYGDCVMTIGRGQAINYSIF